MSTIVEHFALCTYAYTQSHVAISVMRKFQKKLEKKKILKKVLVLRTHTSASVFQITLKRQLYKAFKLRTLHCSWCVEMCQILLLKTMEKSYCQLLGENKIVLMYGGHIFPCQSCIWSTTVLHNTYITYIKTTIMSCAVNPHCIRYQFFKYSYLTWGTFRQKLQVALL